MRIPHAFERLPAENFHVGIAHCFDRGCSRLSRVESHFTSHGSLAQL